MIDPTADYASNQHQPAPRVPDFELIRPIGWGGFGQVWLATNRTTGHLRAVKVIGLGGSGTTDPAGREITSITRLEQSVHTHHPNLLDIQHVGKTAEHLFYVMEPADDLWGGPASADGGYRPATLQSKLETGPLGPEECLRYAEELLGGLAHLHTAGMVHRDVKPANCLFLAGQLKLGDFGLLAEADPQVSRVGTQKYMPPDGRMDTRADVFAAGLVVYEMITGLPVESFPRLGQRAPQIAQSPILHRLNRLVLRACQPNPQRRFRDAREMAAELAAREPESGLCRRWSRRRIILSSGAAAICLVLAAVGAWFSWPAPAQRPVGVDVSFITRPYEAMIYLDDELLKDEDGRPYRTPCTIEGLPARVHHVQFQYDGGSRQDAGLIDFATVRQITADFGSGSSG